MTSLMNSAFRSSCKVWLVTYQGAFVIIHSILDWLHCILAICNLLAHHHNLIPWVQIDFMIVLYRSTLLFSDTGDFLPITQYKCFTFRSVGFLFLAKCSFHISLESKCRPRYFAVGDCGITVLFMCTAGHCSFLSVKVTCTDLITLMLIHHFFSQASSWSRWPCSLCEAVSGSSWRARMTMSSANVPVVVWILVGRPVV
jgi:hypothetical protein